MTRGGHSAPTVSRARAAGPGAAGNHRVTNTPAERKVSFSGRTSRVGAGFTRETHVVEDVADDDARAVVRPPDAGRRLGMLEAAPVPEDERVGVLRRVMQGAGANLDGRDILERDEGLAPVPVRVCAAVSRWGLFTRGEFARGGALRERELVEVGRGEADAVVVTAYGPSVEVYGALDGGGSGIEAVVHELREDARQRRHDDGGADEVGGGGREPLDAGWQRGGRGRMLLEQRSRHSLARPWRCRALCAER